MFSDLATEGTCTRILIRIEGILSRDLGDETRRILRELATYVYNQPEFPDDTFTKRFKHLTIEGTGEEE